jgi:flagellar basal-body rod protein FlgG
MRSLSIAATGMLAQQTNVDVISNNIANMNTTAFKRQRAEFQDLLYQQVARPGASTGSQDSRAPSGIQIGAGVRTGGVYRIGEQGALSQGSRFPKMRPTS